MKQIYPQAMFDRLYELRSEGASMRAALDAVRSEFGGAPSMTRSYNEMRRMDTGETCASSMYSAEYRQRYIDAARNVQGSTFIRELIERIGPEVGGRFPSVASVSLWLKNAGASMPKPDRADKWTSAQRAEIMELIMGEGLKISTAISRFRKSHGSSPGYRKVVGWLPDEFMARYHAIHSPETQRDTAPLSIVGRTFMDQDQAQWDTETERMCKRGRRRLWWSAATSNNPRWNPNAGQAGRMAA